MKAFAVLGYASVVLGGLPDFFAPKQLSSHVPMMAAGLVLVVLAWAATTNWRLWLGWLLTVIAIIFFRRTLAVRFSSRRTAGRGWAAAKVQVGIFQSGPDGNVISRRFVDRCGSEGLLA